MTALKCHDETRPHLHNYTPSTFRASIIFDADADKLISATRFQRRHDFERRSFTAADCRHRRDYYFIAF